MKDIRKLSATLKSDTDKVIKNVQEAMMQSAEDIWSDIIDTANYKTGEFVSTITIDPIEKINNTYHTTIGSDMMVTSKAGNSYNLGYLLENGTEQHAIPNAFGWGEYHGYTDDNGVFHKGTLDDDWHPGTEPYLFYKDALEKNKDNFKTRIRKAVKEGMK